jgi:maltoporin
MPLTSFTKIRFSNLSCHIFYAVYSWATDIGARLYRRDSPNTPTVLLTVGMLLTMATAAIAWTGKRYCRRHLKVT